MIEARITPREKEVIHWLSVGKTSNDISAILGCAFATVETHKQRVMNKLGVSNVAAMVGKALRQHIID